MASQELPEAYQYTLLDTTRQQIRLVKLRKPFFPVAQQVVYWVMETFDIETAPEYIALSYVWGDASEAKLTCMENKPLKIRENLFDFLVTFRTDEANTSYLWIDQLGIDQTAVGERNHQVRLMSGIYRQCNFVIVWLGCPAAETKSSLSLQTSEEHSIWTSSHDQY
jgi:hypothetical protein